MSEIRIQEVQEKAPLMDKLVELWEASVRATHHFLSDTEVNQIKEYVPQAVGFYLFNRQSQRMFQSVGFEKTADEWYEYKL